MAGYLNKVQLIGNLGRAPEIRSLQSGSKVMTLSIATAESWIDKRSGERREQTDWHRVVIFSDGLAKVVETCLHKGSKVYIEGSLKTRKWTDQRNEDRYTTEIVLQPFNGKLIMLDDVNNRETNDRRDPSDDAASHDANNGEGSATSTDNAQSNDIPC